MEKTLIQAIAETLSAYRWCLERGNDTKVNRERLCALEKLLPSGSGFDKATRVDVESTDSKIFMYTSFHHMNEVGYYDGWTDHTVIVTPTFSGIDITVTGRDKNDIKNYIGEVFYDCLRETVNSP
jgi:hypothetical protein